MSSKQEFVNVNNEMCVRKSNIVYIQLDNTENRMYVGLNLVGKGESVPIRKMASFDSKEAMMEEYNRIRIMLNA